MDEKNPAYENFLNNMTRLGGSPRETTRKVSASSFLGRDNIAAQVELNSRKITILKNVIQAQQGTTGVMLQSLSHRQRVSIKVSWTSKKRCLQYYKHLKHKRSLNMKSFLIHKGDCKMKKEGEERQN